MSTDDRQLEDQGLIEMMSGRIEIEELGDPSIEKEITEAVSALDGVSETKIEKGALHVSYNPLTTTDKKIEQAIRGAGGTIRVAAVDRQTPHP
jgi:hypothetical protein